MKRTVVLDFEERSFVGKLGEKAGYLFAYFMFTTILYFVLNALHKVPASWTYVHIMGITVGIVLLGKIVGRIFTSDYNI